MHLPPDLARVKSAPCGGCALVPKGVLSLHPHRAMELNLACCCIQRMRARMVTSQRTRVTASLPPPAVALLLFQKDGY
eukprot:12556463-Alexandrium_andersonii.AAC.1